MYPSQQAYCDSYILLAYLTGRRHILLTVSYWKWCIRFAGPIAFAHISVPMLNHSGGSPNHTLIDFKKDSHWSFLWLMITGTTPWKNQWICPHSLSSHLQSWVKSWSLVDRAGWWWYCHQWDSSDMLPTPPLNYVIHIGRGDNAHSTALINIKITTKSNLNASSKK